ncbi:hypothetical protein DPSP01_003047 [Paraphaeosphaeria sporulosa]|uniref:RING-CH-type domain-containing protein n=1 Tax=Paraphaeosphaeria sporulosa TaxID=1460663 RepID=A0A177CMB9_9PLEO|nr:uncharacterized protein CC84DRAFT_536843 [Paraphaeosphaeria sporulosa]OAG08092.1 hypothetical protein CC84DRAFT_536843 [Paraphaeosphaeria sporulosa]
MASLPPQQHQQRRPSPPAESARPEQSNAARTNSFSADSVDSQTLLLNSPPTEAVKPTEADATQQHAPAQAEAQSAEDNEPRRCWICFNDETEDDENTSEWRSPCPCVLVAHEKCLLDWIADMEAPDSRLRLGTTRGKILCPQCKAEIKLDRPRNVIVEYVRMTEKMTKMLQLPIIFFVAGTATYTTLRWFGKDIVYKIFGVQDAQTILRHRCVPSGLPSESITMHLLNHIRKNWQIDLGLPAIPVILVLSRTRMADSFLPFLPLIFLAGGGADAAQGDSLLQITWPPSAAFTVAALPYVRSIYNSYYDRFWAPHERRWLKEVQPRAGTEDEIEADAQDMEDDAEAILNAIADEDEDGEDGEDIVEVEVDVDLLFDWNAGGAADNNNAPENPPVPIARGPAAPPLEAPPVEDGAPVAAAANQEEEDAAAPAPNVPQQHAQPRRPRIRRERNNISLTGSIVDTILGTFIFPGLAGTFGEVLRIALPKSWVTPPSSGKPTGFLQNRWARSIVAGCLLVGLKDAFVLYARWKTAQNHRQRKVLDYDGSKGKRKNKST